MVLLLQHSLITDSFVPAEQATLGLTDKILTRIATKESVSKARTENIANSELTQIDTK